MAEGESKDAKATLTVKVYKPAASTSSLVKSPSTADLPDSYFSPTTHELAVAFQGQSKKRQDLTDGPLLTKRLRDEKAQTAYAAKRRKYPNARIRIKFADQTQLEATIPSTDTCQSIYNFVKSALREDAKTSNFLLYQTPPRRELRLNDPKTKGIALLDLDLAPSSMLYIKFDNDDLNSPANPPPLLASLLETQEDLPPPITFESTATDAGESSSTAQSQAKDKAKVPKWLNKAIGKK